MNAVSHYVSLSGLDIPTGRCILPARHNQWMFQGTSFMSRRSRMSTVWGVLVALTLFKLTLAFPAETSQAATRSTQRQITRTR